MARMKRSRLQAMQALPDYRLRLTFADLSVYTVSLAREIDKFPGFAPLREPQAFAGACVMQGEGLSPQQGGCAVCFKCQRVGISIFFASQAGGELSKSSLRHQ